MTHLWVQAALGQDVDWPVEQFFKVLFKAYKIEKRPIRVHLDQQVEVAPRTVFTPGH